MELRGRATAAWGQLDVPLPPTSVASTPGAGEAPWLATHLLEEDQRAAALPALPSSASASDRLTQAASFSFGRVVEGTVRQRTTYGVVIDLAPGVSGFVIADHAPAGVETETGRRVRGVVLDVDLSKMIVDLSLRPELVEARGAISAAQVERGAARIGRPLNAVLELMRGRSRGHGARGPPDGRCAGPYRDQSAGVGRRAGCGGCRPTGQAAVPDCHLAGLGPFGRDGCHRRPRNDRRAPPLLPVWADASCATAPSAGEVWVRVV